MCNYKVVSCSTCGSPNLESYQLLYAEFYSCILELNYSTSMMHSTSKIFSMTMNSSNTHILKTIDKGKSDPTTTIGRKARKLEIKAG